MKIKFYKIIGKMIEKIDFILFLFSLLIGSFLSNSSIIVISPFIFLLFSIFPMDKKISIFLLNLHSLFFKRKEYKIILLENSKGFSIEKNNKITIFESSHKYIPMDCPDWILATIDNIDVYCFENKVKKEDISKYLKEAYLLTPTLRFP